MCEALGYDVISLTRVRIMNVHLDKLQAGKWRYLSAVEIAELESLVQHSSKT
jgi:23S rRNA pseudouridine2604 synthase